MEKCYGNVQKHGGFFNVTASVVLTERSVVTSNRRLFEEDTQKKALFQGLNLSYLAK